jgi:hypothetical protein
MSETPAIERARGAVTRTGLAVRAAWVRRDARAVLAAVTVAYFAAYLYAIGHLRPGPGGFDILVVADPLSRLTRSLGFLSFEPVARVNAGPLTLLVAPPNVLLGLAIATLVGVNLAVSYLAWRSPAACGIGGGAGAVAGLPALLSGAACCGPVVLIALGIQATGLLLAAFELLLPAAAVLLVGSLLYVGRRVDPTAAAVN